MPEWFLDSRQQLVEQVSSTTTGDTLKQAHRVCQQTEYHWITRRFRSQRVHNKDPTVVLPEYDFTADHEPSAGSEGERTPSG